MGSCEGWLSWARRSSGWPSWVVAVPFLVCFEGVLVLGCSRPASTLDSKPCPPCAEQAASGGVASHTVQFVGPEGELHIRPSELGKTLGPRSRVASFDPYYGQSKQFLGWPAHELLTKLGVGGSDASAVVTLKASDGYEVRLPARQLREDSAWFVYLEADGRALPPIGPRAQDPAPFYLIWQGPDQRDLTTHPRPYSIVEVRVGRSEVALAWLPSGADAELVLGQDSFRTRCARCHALNQIGGRVGPDLNVPENILSYRPEAQVRAYILNPATFRYGGMPAHPDLIEPELGRLIRFLKAMGAHRNDPRAGAPASHGL
jgi:mono/diheme cytochrome c family protein